MGTRIEPKILTRQRDAEEFDLYLAALEWDLADPIVIEGPKDFKSAPHWQESVTPYDHQAKNLITFCRRLPVTLLADDVGLGKTISAGLVMSELSARSRVRNTLIVAPKLLGPQWKEELETKFGIEAEVVTGKRLLRAEPSPEGGAVITTYHSARQYIERIPEDRFQMLVLDEAHKLRNLYGVPKPPQVATVFKKVLEARRFRFVLMLTATPLQNRLWDLYSLIELLTVARGHKNPFGGEALFARRFILDDHDKARRLRPEASEELRSIVYGYMSRIRRGDADLYFPERSVLMDRAEPTPSELELIRIVGHYIAKMNRLVQISILQALCSSPEALSRQLERMAENGTVPEEFARDVKRVAAAMPMTAKLHSLKALIERLSHENPTHWRMVVFTGRIETQTSIVLFLERLGIKAGIINGSTGPKNASTLSGFRAKPPTCHVLVSTEAGSEGINLQVANVLVNYDLPWNPMIVEQRIGRVQRLASDHAKVSIYNVILRGTFEEYIVGRLMEKLQLASHAIGDVEALLEAAGVDGDGENGDESSFEERIRQLVVAALTGKDVQLALRQEEASIARAKETLARERHEIDSMLGASDGREYVGPRAPIIKRLTPRLSVPSFVVAALQRTGAEVSTEPSGLCIAKFDRHWETIRFSEPPPVDRRTVLYAPGAPAFQRLVSQVTASGVHAIADANPDYLEETQAIAKGWADAFGGTLESVELVGGDRHFEGQAYVRVRATVAHDSFESLVSADCQPAAHKVAVGAKGLQAMRSVLEDPAEAGISLEAVSDKAGLDPAIEEFCRFYKERREQEVRAAIGDERKIKKLSEDFTPRLEMSLVGARGRSTLDVMVDVHYRLNPQHVNKDRLTVSLADRKVIIRPAFGICGRSGRHVPQSALRTCEISRVSALPEYLNTSEKTGRWALPEYVVRCALSGRALLKDEVEQSAITGRLIDKDLIRTSDISGKRCEPQYIGTCEFTGAQALQTELASSDVSRKRFRADQGQQSVVSGKRGHASEFLTCAVSGQKLLPQEAAQCEVTGKPTVPALLGKCEITGKYVLPSELERCAVSGQMALKSALVRSSVSGHACLPGLAVRSNDGRYCTPAEGRGCDWSGRVCHPDDLRECSSTGLQVHAQFITKEAPWRLQPLVDLISGSSTGSDDSGLWEEIAERVGAAGVKGHSKVLAGLRSPSGECIAVSAEVKRLLGFKVVRAGCVYSKLRRGVLGRVFLAGASPGIR